MQFDWATAANKFLRCHTRRCRDRNFHSCHSTCGAAAPFVPLFHHHQTSLALKSLRWAHATVDYRPIVTDNLRFRAHRIRRKCHRKLVAPVDDERAHRKDHHCGVCEKEINLIANKIMQLMFYSLDKISRSGFECFNAK